MPAPASPSPTLPPAAAAPPPLTRDATLRLGLLAALFLLAHLHALIVNGRIAAGSTEWNHAFLIPLISLYLVWQNRAAILRVPVQTCWWALPLLLWGMDRYLVVHELGRVTPLAFYTIFNLGALVLFLGGWRLAWALALPIGYLVFAVPTDLLLQPISLRLQMVAAIGSDFTLNLLGLPFGIEAERLGSTLAIWKDNLPIEPPLNIAEACSGLRMLMAFAALGVAIAYLQRERPRWYRLTLMAATLPIAIIANVLRISGMGLAYPWFPGVTSGDLHGALGLLMLLPAIILFNLLERVLACVVPPPPPPKTARPPTPPQRPSPAATP
jgi:exosortase